LLPSCYTICMATDGPASDVVAGLEDLT